VHAKHLGGNQLTRLPVIDQMVEGQDTPIERASAVIVLVTAKVQDVYQQRHPHLNADNIERLTKYLNEEVRLLREENTEAIQSATTRLASLKAQRKKLLHLYYSDRLDDQKSFTARSTTPSTSTSTNQRHNSMQRRRQCLIP